MPVEEYLKRAAFHAHALAESHCCKDGAEGCRWYHGTWPYLRLIGMGSSAPTHAHVLVPALQRIARGGDYSRVLISGAADHGSYAVLLNAYALLGLPIEVTVVDRCETPLALHRWFAQLHGRSVETRCEDILATSTSEPFDLICTHAFLGYFDAQQRSELVRRWRSMVRSGGKVVLIQRLRPGQSALVKFDAAQRERLVSQVEAWLRERGQERELSFLPHATRVYAERFESRPVGDAAELEALFEACGFTVDRIDPVVSSDARADSGPSVAHAPGSVLLEATAR